MTNRVVLHVGGPKSGTTYIQRILERNRETLGRHGVLVVGEQHVERVHAAFVIRDDPRLDGLPDEARGAWSRLVAEIRGWPGDLAVLSYELLSAAAENQAAAALADLAGMEVHVVVTARDFAAAVPSAWQERLKFALTTPLEAWRPKPESAPRAEWGWRTLDPAGVAQRWGATLPPDHVHVVTVPRGPGDHGTLWRRFATAAGIAADDLDLDIEVANESLGVGAAELLRRVNEVVGASLPGGRDQARWLRDTLAHQILAPLDDEPIGLTEEQYAEALRLSEESIARIEAAGYDVVGQLQDLRASRRAGRTPGEVTDEELLRVAVRAVGALLLRLRGSDRTGSGPRAGSRPGPHGGGAGGGRLPAIGQAVRGLATRAAARPVLTSIDDAQRRLDTLERAMEERRQLHQRLAMVSDLVTELLLPLGERDVEVPAEAIRRYRKETL